MNGRLSNLIRALRELSAQIFSRVLLGRMERRAGGAAAGSNALPIRALVAECVAEPAAVSGSPAATEPVAEAPVGAQPPTREASPPLVNDLSGRFARHRGQRGLDSLMAEKMRATTLEHLNRALILARRGQGDGARIHADLAETAMETAAKYMSEEEYRALESEVERRLSLSAPSR